MHLINGCLGLRHFIILGELLNNCMLYYNYWNYYYLVLFAYYEVCYRC